MMAKSNRRRDQDRRSAAAAKVAELRLAQEASERRRRAVMISASVVVVIAVVVAVAVIVSSHTSKQVAAGAFGSGATVDYGIVVGGAAAPVTMTAYEDFQCPHCEELEHSLNTTIAKDIAQGILRVEYRPVAFLSEYSTRALNAAVCVNRAGGGTAFKRFHDILYANQPAEGSGGLPNSQLVTYANQALGRTSPKVATCIDDGIFDDWASSATDAFSKATSNNPSGASTPTVLLNGVLVSSSDILSYEQDPSAFQAALDRLTNAS